MNKTYDAIVVGARCAGSATAMLLARKGLRVLLVDRTTFPSDSMRGHMVRYRGVRTLHRWGLLERVAASNCPPIRRMSLDLGDYAMAGEAPTEEGIAGEYAPRRYVLDAILAEAATASGAELWDGCTVEEVLIEDGRAVGIRGRLHDGTPVAARARVIVGADGLHSLVARAVGATTYREVPALTCGYYSYWSGPIVEGIEIHVVPHPAGVLAFQTNDGLTCVAIQWPIADFHAVRADIEGNFFATLDAVPDLAERVHQGRREERYQGTADLPNFFRTAAGPGWALVGDAGLHKDPLRASGISDAFRDAELLAGAIAAGLAGAQPLDDALAGYGRARDAAAIPIFEDVCRAAAFTPPPPPLLQLRARIRGNQQAINRFLGVDRGLVAPEEFLPQGAMPSKPGMAAGPA